MCKFEFREVTCSAACSPRTDSTSNISISKGLLVGSVLLPTETGGVIDVVLANCSGVHSFRSTPPCEAGVFSRVNLYLRSWVGNGDRRFWGSGSLTFYSNFLKQFLHVVAISKQCPMCKQRFEQNWGEDCLTMWSWQEKKKKGKKLALFFCF